MKKSLSLASAILFAFQLSLVGQINFQPSSVKLTVLDNDELLKSLKEFKVVSLDLKGLNALRKGKKNNIEFHISIENYKWNITLEENELRAPKYQIAENDKTTDLPLNSCIT